MFQKSFTSLVLVTTFLMSSLPINFSNSYSLQPASGDLSTGRIRLLLQKLPVTGTEASSTFPAQDPTGYWPNNAVDGDTSTLWISDSGDTIGAWLSVTLPTPSRVESMNIYTLGGPDNGGRIQDGELLFSDGTTQSFSLPDVRGWYSIPVGQVTTTFVQVIVHSVYPGTSFDDVIISEVEFYGEPVVVQPTSTPPAVQISFFADAYTITQGQCTTLHWDVENAQAVFLDEQPVTSQGTQEACPQATTTYTLRVVTSSGDVSKTVTVTVSEAVPTNTLVPSLQPTATWTQKPVTSTSSTRAITPSRTPTVLTTPSPSRTTSRTPTVTNTPQSPDKLPEFTIIDVQTKPSSINQFERTYLQVKISTGDAKLPANYWSNFSFSGEVVLKSSDGQPVTNPIPFIDDENAYWLPTTVYDEKLGLTKLNLGEIQITANLNFNKAVQDGIMEVFVYTNDKPRQTIVYALPINVSNQDLKIVDCASVIADKISVAWPGLSAAKKLIALNRFRAEITNCDNLSCASEKLREYVWELLLESEARKLGIEEAGELLVATRDAVYGQDSLELCRKPALWLYSIIGEYIRSGIPINMRAVHSPALLMVTNPAGERVGFWAKNNPVTEINGSIAFIYKDSQFVYYPAQNVTTQLTGTGEGFMTVEAMDIREDRIIDTSFIDVPVSSETIAYVNMTSSSNEISLMNGSKSQTIQADYEVIQEIQPRGESTQSGGGLGLGVGLVVLVLGSVSILVLRNRARRRVSYADTPKGAGLVRASGSRTDITSTDFVIGRGSNCNLRLPDRAVSRQHARIRYAQGRWFIQDMGSKSGTYVNDARVDAIALNNGDRIRIASAEFMFRV